MNIEEIKVAYYNDALALAQRALLSGLIVCAIAYSVIITGEGKSNYIVPFFNIELSSERTFSITLLVLFFVLGLICSYAIEKANKIRRSIADIQLSSFLLEAPNVLYSNLYIRAILYGSIFGAGTGLIKNLIELDTWAVSLGGSVLAGPYFLALYSSNPHNRKN